MASLPWDPGRVRKAAGKLGVYARLVRIEHTLFSLPFATIGLLIARATNPIYYVLAFLSLMGLRGAAMVFNNLADVDIDAANPRTSSRPLVAGIVSVREALGLLAVFTILYYVSAYLIGYAAFYYATPLYILALSYPYAKRVHYAPHLHLGLVLGMAVFGGWVAGLCSRGYCDVRLALISAPWLIVAGVALWVAGFDTLYTILDYEYDKKLGVKSLPVLLGPRKATIVAFCFEIASTILWAAGGYLYSGVASAVSSMLAGILATYSVALVMRDEDSIPKAFNLNLAVGFIALAGYIVDWAA